MLVRNVSIRGVVARRTSLTAACALRCSSGRPFSSPMSRTGINVLKPSVALMLYTWSRNCTWLTLKSLLSQTGFSSTLYLAIRGPIHVEELLLSSIELGSTLECIAALIFGTVHARERQMSVLSSCIASGTRSGRYSELWTKEMNIRTHCPQFS